MGMRERMEERMRNLTPEERQKLDAAREKTKGDPKVVAAMDDLRATRQDFQETMHAAMLKDDPSLEPILQKVKTAQEKRFKNGPPQAGKAKAGHGAGGSKGPLADLTPEERQQLHAAREKVMDNADVKSVRDRMEQAMKARREAEKSALLAADPSLGPILEKMKGPKTGGGPGMGPKGGGKALPGEMPDGSGSQ